MHIVNAESKGYSQRAAEELAAIGTVTLADADRAELSKLVQGADVLIVRLRNAIDREMLDLATGLHTIVTATTGLNHIDVEYAASKGISVLSLRGETEFLSNVTATAELTFGLILSLVRKIPSSVSDVRDMHWDRDRFKGHEVKCRTLGIVGYGRLGRIVAEYARAFRMNVVVHDPYVEFVPKWCSNVSLQCLLEQSDIVSLHVPLNAETELFWGSEEFSRMKKGAFFVNTSRGELVDEGALLYALKSGQLAGVGVDVVTGEVADNTMWMTESALIAYAKEHDNLLITPHIGGATYESMEDTELFMVDKLKKHLGVL